VLASRRGFGLATLGFEIQSNHEHGESANTWHPTAESFSGCCDNPDWDCGNNHTCEHAIFVLRAAEIALIEALDMFPKGSWELPTRLRATNALLNHHF
jgi:hypothetical protein